MEEHIEIDNIQKNRNKQNGQVIKHQIQKKRERHNSSNLHERLADSQTINVNMQAEKMNIQFKTLVDKNMKNEQT